MKKQKTEAAAYFSVPLISQYPSAEALEQLQVTIIYSQKTENQITDLVDALGY